MYTKEILENGITVVYERIPYVRSVSFGVWIEVGSRYENAENNGVSHFIEHMMFKGTKKRTSKEIAVAIDNIGGQMNAFTGKEATCYYTKTLDTDLETAIDLLSDMIFNSTFLEKDIRVEKKIITEEIKMYEDYPEEMVCDVLSESVWNGDSLGYPILGSYSSIELLNREKVMKYLEKYYTAANCVIAVAGNFEREKLIYLIEKYFSRWKNDKILKKSYQKPEFNNCFRVRRKDTELAHLCIGYKGIEYGDDDVYSLLAINSILGGGMSSRLFQKVREEKGLAYSIYSYPLSYRGAGLYAIYAAVNAEKLNEVVLCIKEEIEDILINSISDEDLEKAKNQLKGNFILGLESTSSRMNSIGKAQLILGRIKTPEEVLKKIESIDLGCVENVLTKVFNNKHVGVSLIGNVQEKQLEKDIFRYFS